MPNPSTLRRHVLASLACTCKQHQPSRMRSLVNKSHLFLVEGPCCFHCGRKFDLTVHWKLWPPTYIQSSIMSHQTPPVGSWTRHPFLLVQVSIAFSPCHSTPGWTCKTCKTEGRRAHQHAHAFDLPPSRAHPCPKRCRNRHPTPVVKQCFWNKTRGHVSIDASLGASMGSGLSPGGSRGTSEKDTFDGIPPTFPQNLNQQMAAETRAHAFKPHWHANMKPWFANMKLFKSTRNSISWENVVCRVSIYVSICMQLDIRIFFIYIYVNISFGFFAFLHKMECWWYGTAAYIPAANPNVAHSTALAWKQPGISKPALLKIASGHGPTWESIYDLLLQNIFPSRLVVFMLHPSGQMGRHYWKVPL